MYSFAFCVLNVAVQYYLFKNNWHTVSSGSQRGLGLQDSGLKNAGLQGFKAKISGL